MTYAAYATSVGEQKLSELSGDQPLTSFSTVCSSQEREVQIIIRQQQKEEGERICDSTAITASEKD